MNKPSERIVVFVTPAQKRAISAAADNLGISISELMRRAVLSFGATSEQVKAASIVDRLRAPRGPDALNEALQRVARASNRLRQNTPAALKPAATRGKPAASDSDSVFADADAQHDTLAPIDLARPVDPANPLTAVSPVAALAAASTLEHRDEDAAEAAARVAAAKAAALASRDAPDTRRAHADPHIDTHADAHTPSRPSTLLSSKGGATRKRPHEQEDDEAGVDPAEGNGRFA
ncbi:hypothetical protein J8I87_09055 [Paraburkholderia sp. LEh10]|uniref:plasmid mobilization protein n=1 Tax=Paraburkholderia sp. LEh10 TaxID=2821353 RepID=UPI001AE1ADBA|nr:hypothetical protein [Paraburkholderia sp. LEh10]MBP0589863.1 hypothetical protein [Paraburkholderia sp. LEh10]